MRTRRAAPTLLALLGAALPAQEARSDIPYSTATVSPQVYRPPSGNPAPGTDLAVRRPQPVHELLPLPEGTGTRPIPDSPPMRFAADGGGRESPGDPVIWFNRSIVQPGHVAGWPPEPQAVVEHDAVLFTHSGGAALSGDSGASWSRLVPQNMFPQSDGGFFGEQRLMRTYAGPNLLFWIMQYWYSATTQTGRHRLAVARNRYDVKNTSFYFYDLTPQTFGFAAGMFLDSPDIACSNSMLYGSANVYRGSDNANVGSVLWRISLAQLDAGGNIDIAYYTRAQLGSELYRLTQVAADTMFAAARWDTTTLRFYWWPDAGNISFENKTIARIATARVSAPGPDGRDWAGGCDHRILGAYVAGNEVGFLHSSSPVTGRPNGFIRASLFDATTRALIREQDMWLSSATLLYPSVCRNARGHKAVVLTLGGGSWYPSTVAIMVDDFAPSFSGNAMIALSTGITGPTMNRWGDYNGITYHPLHNTTWVAPAYSLQTDSEPSGTDIRFVWFGRERDAPRWIDVNVAATDLSGTWALNPSIAVLETDRFLNRDGIAPFTRSYATRQAVTLTAPARVLDQTFAPFRFHHWTYFGGNLPVGQQTLYIDDIGRFLPVDATASYERLRLLDVASFPVAGVDITIDTPDVDGLRGGITPFRRTHVNGAFVTLTAPPQVGSRLFRYWTVNLVRQPAGRNVVNVDLSRHAYAFADYGGTAGNGTTWRDLTALSPASPAPRNGHAMAFDHTSGRCVLFGGTGSTLFGDTWELDGSTWTQRTPTTSPSPRSNPAMVWSPTLRRMVLFGGQTAPFVRNGETWTWDGTDWTLLNPPTSPSPRSGSAMVWHDRTGVALLFGGTDASGPFGAPVTDTWAFDGVTWTRLTPAQSPPQMSFLSMTYDRARDRAVLSGHATGLGGVPQLWEWNGADWARVSPPTMPANRTSVLTYDGLRARTVLFSGRTSGSVAPADSWEWNGAQFTQRVTPSVPPARHSHALVHDTWRQRCVLFGGSQPPATLGDTWEYAYACDTIGEGSPGGGLEIVCTSPPQIGQAFCVAFPSARGSGLVVFGLGGPLRPPIAVLPPIACRPGSLHTAPDVVLSTTGNPASLCVSVPNTPALVHAALVLQGLDLTSAFCFELTDAIAVVVQP